MRKKEEEERDKIRRKLIPILERANKNRRDNLTKKERRGMWEINRRNYLVIQVLMDVEDILCNEKKEEEERDKIRRKVILIMERANKYRRDNLT